MKTNLHSLRRHRIYEDNNRNFIKAELFLDEPIISICSHCHSEAKQFIPFNDMAELRNQLVKNPQLSEKIIKKIDLGHPREVESEIVPFSADQKKSLKKAITRMIEEGLSLQN